MVGICCGVCWIQFYVVYEVVFVCVVDFVGWCVVGQVQCYQWFECYFGWQCGEDVFVICLCLCGGCDWWFQVWYDDGVVELVGGVWQYGGEYVVVLQVQVLVVGMGE